MRVNNNGKASDSSINGPTITVDIATKIYSKISDYSQLPVTQTICAKVIYMYILTIYVLCVCTKYISV